MNSLAHSLRARRTDSSWGHSASVGRPGALRLRADGEARRHAVPHVAPYGDAEAGRAGRRSPRRSMGPLSARSRSCGRARALVEAALALPRNRKGLPHERSTPSRRAPGAPCARLSGSPGPSLALIVWGVVYRQLEPFSDWLVALLPIEPGATSARRSASSSTTRRRC